MGGIIWLASYPKSGNTWMRAYLHNLFRNPARPADINELDSIILGDSQKRWYQAVADRPLDQLTEEEIWRLTPKMHRYLASHSPESVFVKTHNMIGLVYDIPIISMDVTAGAIHIVRNPLDVVISLADHFGLDIDGGIALMNDDTGGSLPDHVNQSQMFGSWKSHTESWMHLQGHNLLVRYEDMMKKPRSTFTRVAKFLGLNPPRERIERAINHSSFRVLQNQEKQHGFKEKSVSSEKFFRSGKSGQWRQTLSKEQVDAIVEANYELMQKLHYLP